MESKTNKTKIPHEVLSFMNMHGSMIDNGKYPLYFFYPFWLRVETHENFEDGIVEIISFKESKDDVCFDDMLNIYKSYLPEPELKVEEIERIDSIIFELDERLYDLCHELISTPFFMFKKCWQLKAQIKQIKSIKSMIKGFV